MSGSSCGTLVARPVLPPVCWRALLPRGWAWQGHGRCGGRGQLRGSGSGPAPSTASGEHRRGALGWRGGGGAAGSVHKPVGSGRAFGHVCYALRQSSWSAARASPFGPRCVERSLHPWHVRFCVCCIAYVAACEPCPRGSLGGVLPFLGAAAVVMRPLLQCTPVDIPCFCPAANFMAVCFSCCAFLLSSSSVLGGLHVGSLPLHAPAGAMHYL